MTSDIPHSSALPVTAEQWLVYLGEYSAWFLSEAPERMRSQVTDEQRRTRWLGREPATEQLLAATEERLGVRLPPSLRGFLRTSDGWGPVSAWTSALSPCDQIDWFRNTDDDFIDGRREAFEDDDEEMGEDDIFLHALSIALGDDTILLDTRSVSAEGEYEAYILAVSSGELHEPSASFSEVIAKGRAQIEYVRSLP